MAVMSFGGEGPGTASVATPGAPLRSHGDPARPPPPRSARIPALDGVRALAVIAVMAYHGGVVFARGGFLGVDVFFVLSGYLITTLLLAEWGHDHRINLSAFWARRARRLLPALVLLLLAVACYARLSAPADTLGSLRRDALATLAYVANWRYILAGRSYFARSAAPSLLQHTWSLAIEEQFYLVWPLIVLLVLRGGTGRRVRLLLGLTTVAAVASAMETGLLYRPAADPSRVYFGTDTHAQSVLVGAVLAIGLYCWGARLAAVRRQAWSVVAALALVLVVWAAVAVTAGSPRLYRGGFLAIDLATAALVLALVLGRDTMVSRLLGVAPMRSVGAVSYGLYLWHWPVFLVIDRARTGLHGPALLAARVAATAAIATVSYHAVEGPIRNRRLPRLGARILAPVSVGVTIGAVLVGTATTPLAGAVLSRSSSSVAMPATATAPPAGPSSPIRSSPPTRVLIEGDSVAMTLGQGLIESQAAYGLDITDKGALGCGVTPGNPVRSRGNPLRLLPECVNWAARWSDDVNRFDPTLAVVLIGRWDVMDREIDGHWVGPADPRYEAALTSSLQQVIQVLGAHGARVAFLTMPCLHEGEQANGSPWPEDDPARIGQLNDRLRSVAAASAGKAVVVDLAALACPGGRYVATVNGVQVRYTDGVHFTIAGGEWVAPGLLPQIAALVPGRP